MSMRLRFLLLSLLVTAVAARAAFAADVAAVITQVIGAVYVKPADKKDFRVAKKGEFIYEGSVIKTGAGDKAALSFVNGIEVKINESTTYVVKPTHPARRGQGSDTGLQKGQMWFKLLKKGAKFQIKTPVAAVSIRGTEGDVSFGNTMRAMCYEGSFNVAALKNESQEVAPEEGVPVSAGQSATVEPGKSPQVQSMEKKETWHNQLKTADKGSLRITLAKAEVAKNTSVAFAVNAYDANQREATSLSATVRLYSDLTDLEFSRDGQTWTKGPFQIAMSGGVAKGYVRSTRPGYANVNAQLDGYDAVPARFSVTKPLRRDLDVEVEDADGNRKKFRLKFLRQ